jgi:hypothetical protein
MEIYSNIFNFSLLLQLKELSFYISVIQKLEILESIIYYNEVFILDSIFNTLIINVLVLFELNYFCMLDTIIGHWSLVIGHWSLVIGSILLIKIII